MKGLNNDSKFMARALALAKKGLGATKTNPLVGCVIVRNGKISSTGHHGRFGGPHAEAIALKNAGKKAAGATLYVNLEPCVAFKGKKTGPCSGSIISAGIGRVVIGMEDPNPKVKGRGLALLHENGIEITKGVMKKEAKSLNAPYEKFIATKKPFVILKVALSLDGKISKKGRKYFSGRESLEFAHLLRAQSDAILVGIGTVLADDPSLTTRLVEGKDPLRVILDAKLRIPLNSKVLADKNALIFCANAGYGKLKRNKLEKMGIAAVPVASKSGILDWNAILLELGRRNVGRLLIEGGFAVIRSALEAGVIDKAYFIIVPEIFGAGLPLFATPLKKAPRLKLFSSAPLGKDELLEFRRA